MLTSTTYIKTDFEIRFYIYWMSTFGNENKKVLDVDFCRTKLNTGC